MAKKQVSQKCWAYYYSAADDLFSKSYNHEVYQKILLRPRVFVDCTESVYRHEAPGQRDRDAIVRLTRGDGPPGASGWRSGHRQGHLKLRRHAGRQQQRVPDAGADRGRRPTGRGLRLAALRPERSEEERGDAGAHQQAPGPLQVYRPDRWTHRCRASASTTRRTTSEATSRWTRPPTTRARREAAGRGAASASSSSSARRPTWSGIRRCLGWREHTDLPIVLKGADARGHIPGGAVCSQHPGSIKAVILSNQRRQGSRHGAASHPYPLGNTNSTAPRFSIPSRCGSTAASSAESDVVKALCLGAKAVGVGRAALWGLGAGGSGWKVVERSV